MTSDYKDYRIIKGILNQDEIWEGKILIPAPLKIPRGVKVRVLPGTEIILSGLSVEKKDQKGIGAIEKYNKSYSNHFVDLMEFPKLPETDIFIEVEGTLVFEGDQTNKILVKGEENAGGIIVSGESSKLQINNAYFSGVSLGTFAFDGASISVGESEFSSSEIGLLLISASADVEKNTYSDNTIGMLFAEPNSLVLSENSIIKNKDYGIVFNSLEKSSGLVKISKNKIKSNDVGIHINRVIKPEILSNDIEENRIGVYMSETPSGMIKDNSFLKQAGNDLILGGGAEAIRLEANLFKESQQVLDCMQDADIIFSDNKISGSQVGISLRERGSGLIENNLFLGENNELTIALSLSQEAEATFSGNKVKGAVRGVRISDSARADIYSNKISTSSSGILADAMSLTKISENELVSGEAGLVFEGEASSEVISNNIEGKTGIITDGVSEVLFRNNSVEATETVLQSSGGSRLTVLEGKLSTSSRGVPGIDIVGLAILDFRESTISAPLGIAASGNAQLEIKDSKISSVSSGINIVGSSRCLMTGSRLTSLDGICFVSGEASFSEVKDNSFLGKDGFEIRGRSETLMQDNTLKVTGIGLRAVEDSSLKLSGGSFTGGEGAEFGILLGGNSSSEIRGLKMLGFINGIKTEESSSSELTGNILESLSATFSAYGSTHTVFEGNTLSAQEDAALSFSMDSRGRISENSIAAETGVLLDGSSQISADNNRMEISRHGFFLRENSSGLLKENTLISLEEEESVAFYLSDLAEAEVFENQIEGFETGVMADFNGRIKATANNFSAFLKGFDLSQESAADIENNQINAAYGVYQSGSSELSARKNQVKSGKSSFYLRENASADITENKILSDENCIECQTFSEIVISNNEFEASLSCLVFAGESSGLVENNSFTGLTALTLDGLSGVELKKNAIKTTGVALRGSGDSRLKAYENHIVSSGEGVSCLELFGLASMELSDNKISGDMGLQIAGNVQLNLRNNKIESKTSCINISGTSVANLIENRFHSSEGICLVASEASSVVISDNSFSGDSGIEIRGQTDVESSANIFRLSGFGVRAVENSSIKLVGGSFTGDAGAESGIFLAGTSRAEIRGLEILGFINGIKTEDASSSELIGNTIKSIGGAFNAYGSTQTIFKGNTVSTQEAAALSFSLDSRGEVSENTIISESGVLLDGNSQVSADNNRMEISRHGFFLRENASGVFTANTLISTEKKESVSFYFTSLSEGEISENKIEGFGVGVIAEFNSRVKAKDNNFSVHLKAFDLSQESVAHVDNNKITAPCGVYQSGSSELFAQKNTLKTSEYGFYIKESSQSEISENKIEGVDEESISVYISNLAEASLSNNEISLFGIGVMADFNTKIKIFENKLGVFLKAVEISHESIAEIRSNIITAPRGLQQGGNSESSLIDNTINASAYGFYVQDTALIVANGNKLTGEEGDSIGLYLGGGAEANIKENSMLGFSGGCKVDGAASLSAGNNQVEAIKHGFEFAGNSSGSLEDNKISAENGIYQSGCSSMIGLRNNFSRVKHGVYLLDETKSEMIENILEGDSEDSLGFYCGGVSEAIFSSNILSNFTNGLRADSSANVIAKENKLTCTGDGFAFLGSTESQLETNQVKSLDGIALVYLMESGGQAFKNTLSGLTGIECSATTQLKAEENIIEFKDYGINARDKASLVLVGNSMKGKGTTSAGVFLGGFTQAKLEKNNIQAGRAFFASDNSATSAKENTFEGIEDALILSGASETILENNKILSEEGAGLLFSLEATGSLSENFIEAMGGIKSSGSAELDLNKNEIKTKKYAVHLSGNSLARLKENKLFGDYSLGICFEVGGNASISARGNTVKKFKEMVHSFENASLRLVSNHFEEIYEGMRFEGCAEGDLKENIIHCDNGDCLVFTDRSTGNLLANRIYSPGGVSLFGSSEVKVQENIFEVKDSALRLKGQSQGQVAKSKFLLSGAKSIAVTIGGLSGGVFNSNHIDAPEGAGFFISSEGECDLIKNEITSLNGLEASAMGNVRLKENRFYIKGCAVRMDQQSNLEATDNYIKGTSDTSSGFELTGISRSEITSNTLEDLMVGLKLDTSAKVQLQKNNISCIATACEAGGTAEVALSENKIFCKRGISFVFRLEASGSLENNLINAPGVLDLSGSAEVKFRENVLSFRVFGVRGSGQSRGDFYLNKLTGNAENSVGFDLADAAEALITEDIIQNVHTALKTADSSQIKISSGRLDANHVAVSAKSVSQVVVEGCYVSSQDLSATLDDECSGLFMESLFFSPKSIKASGLSHLSFQENTVNVSEWGLVCSDQVTLSVKGNKIKGTGLENSVGIELSGMSEASIEECLVQNFTLNFKIVEEARAGLKANEILDGVIGIKIEDLSEVSAISNKILRNQVGIKYNSLISSLTSRDNEMADNAVNIYDSCLESVDPEIDSQGWSFQKKLRERVIVSSRLFPLKIVYSLYYKIALFIIGAAGLFFLNSRFYVRRGLLLKDWIPGMSDIDLFMLIKKRTPSKEKKFVKFSSGFFRIFKKLFPILGEIHSGTWEELELFMKHGGVRAWEASDRWRPLLHSRSLPKLKEASSRQFRLSCASEILNSLQQMSKNIYWDMEALSSIQVMKATADILKYKMYLEGEKNRFNSRKEVFDAALLNLELSKTLSLLIEKISLAWVDRNPCFIPLEKLFYQLLLLVTPGIISLNKELFLEPVTDYRIIEYPGGRDRLGKMPEWKGLCIRLRSGAEKSVRKIVQENPGLFYIIIENNIKEEDYHKLIESSRKVKKESLLTATKIFLMTEAMYELMASTLHFEIPNNFAFSEIPGGYRIKEFSLYKRFEYELAKSGPSLFINSGSSEMLKEAVVKAAVSYRYSFYNDREMDAPFYILYKLNKPFELLIALEDHIFLSPPLIECMRDYYSEAVNQNENFDSLNDKIGDLSDEEISGFSPREIFFETYEEISDVVKNLLEILANSPL